MLKGCDISSHQGNIDWGKVKSQVDFAIIRLGYGDNIERPTKEDVLIESDLTKFLENKYRNE